MCCQTWDAVLRMVAPPVPITSMFAFVSFQWFTNGPRYFNLESPYTLIVVILSLLCILKFTVVENR